MLLTLEATRFSHWRTTIVSGHEEEDEKICRMENWWLSLLMVLYRISYANRSSTKKTFQFAFDADFISIPFNQKQCSLIWCFFSFQHATATDTPDDVVSIWSCTSFLAVFRVECVWTADTTHPDDIAITARRAFTETRPSRSPTKRRADVSTGLLSCSFSSVSQERLMTFPTIACLPQHSIWSKSIFEPSKHRRLNHPIMAEPRFPSHCRNMTQAWTKPTSPEGY